MRRFLALFLGILFLAGCGSKTKQVTGKLIYKGQPVNNVMLHFYPTSDKEKNQPVDIPVKQDGTFITTGLPVGDYKVVVTPPPPIDDMASKMRGMKGPQAEEAKAKLGQNQGQPKASVDVPKKYQDVRTTDLTCNIAGGQQDVTLEMKE